MTTIDILRIPVQTVDMPLPLLLLFASLGFAAEPTQISGTLLKDLCQRQIVLLGEEANHGNANATSVRVELVRRLVNECGFDTFLLEAGSYDFLHLDEMRSKGEKLREEDVHGAIGPMWSSVEMAALVPFLREGLENGRLWAGGIDDQLGTTHYVKDRLAKDLASNLPGERGATCLRTLEKYTSWKYSDADPYAAPEVRAILSCALQIKNVLPAGPRRTMASRLGQFFTRELERMTASGGEDRNARDRAMYGHIREWDGHRAIVWTATVHAAKSLASVQGSDSVTTPFGLLVHQEFGDRAFALGITATTGRYTVGVFPPASAIPPVPLGSLEARPAGYLNLRALSALGKIVGHPINYSPMIAPWNTVLDGLLILREERPPQPVVY